MNGLDQIQEYIKNFINEKTQIKKQIAEIEAQRIQLAQERNQKKKINVNNEVNEIGKRISDLGYQSQELQNQLDFKFRTAKEQINIVIDNSIAEGIRKIRKINEEIEEFENKINHQKERRAKYLLQRQEFYVRFGRMPELSENAKKEVKLQDEDCKKNSNQIEQLQEQIRKIEEDITELARTKRAFKNGNWNEKTIENQTEEVCIKEIKAEEIQTIELCVEESQAVEELYVEEFEPIEELYVETLEPIEELHIEELHIEEFKEEDIQIEEKQKVEKIKEKNEIDPVEELAKTIVEQIVAEQTKEINKDNNEEKIEEVDENKIIFEKEENDEDKIIIPLFGKKATISSIVVKFQNKELVYKAHMSDGNTIKIYPARIGTGKVLLRDSQNREECKKILMNYATTEYKVFDKNVVSKIDPLVCELLIECAQKYNYNAQELIYNYAMSFAGYGDAELDKIPDITYNLSFIETSKLSRKEKVTINKICRNARKNYKIDIIESFSGIRKFKYLLKRIFAVNNVNILPEGKY